MKRSAAILFWTLISASSAGLNLGIHTVSGAEPSAEKAAAVPRSQKRIRHLESQIQRLQAALQKAGEETEAATPAPRFQMLPVGKGVVILDTQTGETRVIQPETGIQQIVEIGKSWVTVTVLVNVPDLPKTRRPQQPEPND